MGAACDICGAVTEKADEEFHQQWHVYLEARLQLLEPGEEQRVIEGRGEQRRRRTQLVIPLSDWESDPVE